MNHYDSNYANNLDRDDDPTAATPGRTSPERLAEIRESILAIHARSGGNRNTIAELALTLVDELIDISRSETQNRKDESR